MVLNFDPNAAAPGSSGVFGLPHRPEDAAVVLIPVPFEATTSYGGGTADGPNAIRAASRQVDLFDIETGRPYQQGVAMLDDPSQVRAWNAEAKELAAPIIAKGGLDLDPVDRRSLDRVNAICDQMNGSVYETSKYWLAQGKHVGTIGGDHSTAFGAIRAHAEKFDELGVLHLDAHADLRDAYEGFTWSHASIMFNVLKRLPIKKLVQVAIRDLCDQEHQLIESSEGRVATYYDAHLSRKRFDGEPWARQVDRIVSELPQQVYLSFDIDGLDPTLCPSTGTPVPGGLSFAETNALVAGVVRSGRSIVGFDLTEVAPSPDGGEWDGNVAARLLYKMIGWTLTSQRGAVAG